MAAEPAGEKVAWDICRKAESQAPAVSRRFRRSIAPAANQSQWPAAYALSPEGEKRFGTGLAGQRIFHIGNAITPPTVP